MTRLEKVLRKFTSSGLSFEEREKILNDQEPPLAFIEIAKEILDGSFVITSGESRVRITPTLVELYYHEENGAIKDNIVYHKNDVKHLSRPTFNLGFLHEHSSGIDITFEFEGDCGICRASALIRAFKIENGFNNDVLEVTNPDSRSTYFPKALLGQFSIFDGFTINWEDGNKISSIYDVTYSTRIGMMPDRKTGEARTEALRPWNFSLMMNDEKTDVVYLSEWLADPKEGNPQLFNCLIEKFTEAKVEYHLLPKTVTKDYWIRDFMPIQLAEGEFLKYKYEPDYLQDKYRSTITNSYKACQLLGLKYRETSIKIDGGNVVVCGNKIIMTDKVFLENGKEIGDAAFKEELRSVFGNRDIIFIPWLDPMTRDPYCGKDVFGHADGFVQYIGDNRIMLDIHHLDGKEYANQIRTVLLDAGFKIVEMDFDEISEGKQNFDRNWAYINFLRVSDNIFLPCFKGSKENDVARSQIQKAFPNCRIFDVEMGDFVKNGGALHCLTWNTQRMYLR